MGGRVATYEDSGEVFLRGRVSGVRGRSYPALQELDSSPLLPSSDFRRDSEFSRRGDQLDYRFYSGLHRHGLRRSGEEIRSLGRRIAKRLPFLQSLDFSFYKNSRVHTNSVQSFIGLTNREEKLTVVYRKSSKRVYVNL